MDLDEIYGSKNNVATQFLGSQNTTFFLKTLEPIQSFHSVKKQVAK